MFARRLFFASHRQATVRLRLTVDAGDAAAARPTLELHRGWIAAIDLRSLAGTVLPSIAKRPEDQLAQLVALDVPMSLEETPPPTVRHGECEPFHPAPVLRNIYDRLGIGADRLAPYLAERPLTLVAAPHAKSLLVDERRLMTQLAARTQTVGDLMASRVLLPERVLHLCGFLLWIGALDAPSERGQIVAALDLPATATDDELRRAYRERVRALHPDLNPTHQDGVALRELNQQWEAWEREAATRRSRG